MQPSKVAATKPELWKIDNYLQFLEARRELLAAETNRLLEGLLHGDGRWLARRAPSAPPPPPKAVPGGIDTKDEEAELEAINAWLTEQGLPAGETEHECAHARTGEPLAVLDLAWPDGLQTGLSQPVAVMLNEASQTLVIAGSAGFRCFTSGDEFRTYVRTEINPLERRVDDLQG